MTKEAQGVLNAPDQTVRSKHPLQQQEHQRPDRAGNRCPVHASAQLQENIHKC